MEEEVLGTLFTAIALIIAIVILFSPKFLFPSDIFILKDHSEEPLIEDFEELMYHPNSLTS